MYIFTCVSTAEQSSSNMNIELLQYLHANNVVPILLSTFTVKIPHHWELDVRHV